MNRPLSALLTVVALSSAGCLVNTNTPPTPCEPNPCSDFHRTQCVVENDEARCLCDSGYVARPSGACELVTEANCPEHFGDLSEPDDCQARSQPLTPDGRVHAQSISPVGDYDFFRIDATARNIYVVTVRPEGSLSPRVDVYDQGAAWVGAHEGSFAEMTFKARVTAPYYARVSQSPVDPSVGTGNYTLTLVSLGAEDHGDSASEATSVTPDSSSGSATPHYGRFELAQDQDWFAFSAVAGASYRIDFDASRGVPSLAVFSGGDTQHPVLTAWNKTFEFTPPVSGTVYLALYPAQGQASNYAFQFFRTN